MRRLYQAGFIVLLAAVFLSWQAPPAQAVPAFARAYGLSCSACHTAWPALNSVGRKFKENGYMIKRGEPKDQLKITDELTLPKTLPLAIAVQSRPFDQKKGGDEKLRALHELEIFIAGNAFQYGSYFAELELEDENDFEVELGHAVAGFHPHQLFNLVVGKGSVFGADPYDSLSNMRRLTRNRRAPMNQGYSTGVALNNEVQMVSLYGRETASNKLFYTLTYAADVADNEGEGPKDFSGRLAFDILSDLTIGGFFSKGSQDKASGGVTKELDFSRVGIDAQARFGGLNLLGAYLRGNDDIFTGGDESNNAWYAEAFYTIGKDDLRAMGIPLFMVVPILRVDRYEKNDGKDTYADLTANLSCYPWQNVKLGVEYFTTLDRPSGVKSDWRWTVLLTLAF